MQYSAGAKNMPTIVWLDILMHVWDLPCLIKHGSQTLKYWTQQIDCNDSHVTFPSWDNFHLYPSDFDHNDARKWRQTWNKLFDNSLLTSCVLHSQAYLGASHISYIIDSNHKESLYIVVLQHCARAHKIKDDTWLNAHRKLFLLLCSSTFVSSF